MRDGAIVQLGTPEELVGSPADEYVANFVRDIPRTNVLTLRWIMRDPAPGEENAGPELPVGTTVKDAVPVVAGTDGTVRATEDGRCVGVVDREAVLRAMAGGDEPARAGEAPGSEREAAAPDGDRG
jgi:glycine betaine/proline transport system ATP-binding protein